MNIINYASLNKMIQFSEDGNENLRAKSSNGPNTVCYWLEKFKVKLSEVNYCQVWLMIYFWVVYCNGVTCERVTGIRSCHMNHAHTLIFWVGHCWRATNLQFNFKFNESVVLLEFLRLYCRQIRPPLFPLLKGSIRFKFFLLCMKYTYTIFYSINCGCYAINRYFMTLVILRCTVAAAKHTWLCS